MILEQGTRMKERVGVKNILMLVQRVKVDLGGCVIKKHKIICLRPPIFRMLVMNFSKKGIPEAMTLQRCSCVKKRLENDFEILELS
jgi:hypothetical protein